MVATNGSTLTNLSEGKDTAESSDGVCRSYMQIVLEGLEYRSVCYDPDYSRDAV